MFGRVGHVALSGGPAQHAGLVEQLRQETRQAAIQRKFLLQEQIDPAHEHRLRRGQRLALDMQRQIKWQHGDVMAQIAQGQGQRVLAQAVAAEEMGRAGSEQGDAHQAILPRARHD